MKTLRYLALAALALLAVRLAGRALRRQDETTRLLWVLIATIAAKSSNTPKTRSVEQRVAALVSAVQPIVQNVAAVTTTANNTASTIATGSTGGAVVDGSNAVNTSPTNASGFGATSASSPNTTSTSAAYPTGQTSSAGSPAHTHDYGGHWHDMQDHTHDFGGHYHFDGHTHPLS